MSFSGASLLCRNWEPSSSEQHCQDTTLLMHQTARQLATSGACAHIVLPWLQDRRDFYKFKHYVIMTRVYTDPLQQQPAAAGKPPAGPSKQPKKQKAEQQQQQQQQQQVRDSYRVRIRPMFAAKQWVWHCCKVLTRPGLQRGLQCYTHDAIWRPRLYQLGKQPTTNMSFWQQTCQPSPCMILRPA